MEQEQDEMMVRLQRDKRRLAAVTSLAVIAAGAFLVLRRPGHEPVQSLALGAFFLMLGAGQALWVWRGDWTPPDAARIARQVIVRRILGQAFRGMELLTLTLALLGLIVPGLFGEYWRREQFIVVLVSVGLLFELMFRIVRWRSASNADEERPEATS